MRAGLLAALASGAKVAGWLDAAPATPPEEMLRILRLFDDPVLDFALASRVAMLGTDVRRHRVRHYLGRLFAMGAAATLDVGVDDTQYGVKALRRTPTPLAALQEPFRARWASTSSCSPACAPPP